LIEDTDAASETVTVWVSSAGLTGGGGVEAMRYMVDVMDELGLRANLKVVDGIDEYLGTVNAGDAQTYLLGWISGYPGAGDFIPPQFVCGAGANASGLCDESLDAAIDEALRLRATDPAAANAAWIEIEHRLVEDGVGALANFGSTYAFSARTENVQVHPQHRRGARLQPAARSWHVTTASPREGGPVAPKSGSRQGFAGRR